MTAGVPEAAYWLALAYASGLKLAQVKAIVAAWCVEGGRSLGELFESGGLDMSADERNGIATATRSLPEQAEKLAHLQSQRAQLVTRADPRYPAVLMRWFPPEMQPLLLFSRGDIGLLSQPSAAVIGSRQAGDEAIRLARELGALLAEEGLAVVSGLGKGVGQAAFEGALGVEGGRSIVVLPMGLQAFTGTSLSTETTTDVQPVQVLFLSPFHPNAQFSEAQATARNKLMMGLAQAVFVVTAGEEDATYDMAQEALRLGKAVYVWDLDGGDEPSATGNQALIKAGGLPVTGVPDILDAVEAIVAMALESAEASHPQPHVPPAQVNQVEEAQAPYDPHAVLDLLSKSGRVPETLARRLRES
jgi:predicted Rossmann fold nucleotide-binding protein DprA/Smf involved in DNA uptake